MQSFLRSQYHKPGLAMMIVLLLSLILLTEAGRAGSEHQTIPTAPPPTATSTSEGSTEVPANPTPTQHTVISPLPTSVQPSQTEVGTVIATVGAVPARTSIEPSTTIETIGGTLPVFTKTPLTPFATGNTPSVTALATLIEEGQESGLATSEALCVIGVGGGLVMLLIGLVWLRRRRES